MIFILKGWIPAGIICTVMLAGCEKDEKPISYAARVHNEYLTYEMIGEKIDWSLGMNEAIVREYISQWITAEILYQEARRRGLDRDERVLVPLQDIRRHLAINALLEDEIYSETFPEIPVDESRNYYEIHREEFIADEHIMEIGYALFDRRNIATVFRNSVLQGGGWEAAIERFRASPENVSALLEVGERGFYRQRDLYPPEKWNAARQLSVGGTSFPVSTDAGYYIIRLHASIQRGSPLPFEYVKNEIHERLVIERRHIKYERLLSQLRQQYSIEVSFRAGAEQPAVTDRDTVQ
jgi:peptidyl-prolyl cis-trans isomerase C